MKLEIHNFQLKLRHAFTISRGTRHAVDSMIVALSENGITGYGEATANPYYQTTVEELIATAEQLRPLIISTTVSEPVAFWQKTISSPQRPPLCTLRFRRGYARPLCPNGRKETLRSFWW